MSEQLNKELGSADVLWNLADLYESVDDELINDDIDLCEQEAALLKEFAGRLTELEPATFARVVRRLERIAVNLGRVATFAYLNFATQVKNAEAGAFLQKVRETASRISRDTVFFDLEWSKMDNEEAGRLLAADDVASYRHYLESIRRYADHLLSQVEETLLIEISPVAAASWTSLFSKVMGHLTFGDKKRSQEEVLADLYSPQRDVRRQAAQEMTAGLQGQLHVLTHIFNTLLADKMIDDRLRGYPSWLSSRNLANEVDDQTVHALVTAVTGRYDIVRRYYGLKKRLLGLDELYDFDRYAPCPTCPTSVFPGRSAGKWFLAALPIFPRRWRRLPRSFSTTTGYTRHCWRASRVVPLPIPACRRPTPMCWSTTPAICATSPPWPMSWAMASISIWPVTRATSTATPPGAGRDRLGLCRTAHLS